MRTLCRHAILLALAALLLGCAQEGERRAGWSGSETPGRLSYSYQFFKGTERAAVRLEVGQLLTIEYNAIVSRGRLSVRVVSPEQEAVWQVELAESGRDRVELFSVLAGTYAVEVQGYDAAGKFDVRWEVTRPE